MNEDKFLDEALKEHARLEEQDDKNFLNDLEEKLDEVPQRQQVNSWKREAFWSVAAVVLIGAIAAFLWQGSQDENQLAMDEAESLQKPPLRTKVAAEGDLFQEEQKSPEAKLAFKKNEVKPVVPPTPVLSELPENRRLFRSEPGKSSTFGRGRPLATPLKPKTKLRMTGMVTDKYSDYRRRIDGDRDGLALVPTESATGEKYGELIEQLFQSPLQAPLSTFSVDVDTASYTNLRRTIQGGHSVDPDAVRIEEMINYFNYAYPQPTGEHPFSVNTEVASCPWNPKHRLVKIGLQGKKIEKGERKAANLVFLIDVSGSMSSSDKLPLLVQSFQLLLKELNENDRVSLVVYAGRQAVVLEPTAISEDGRSQVKAALNQLSAGGSTNGAAGITTAYDLARKGFIEEGVNRVILATDGDFNVGLTGTDELLKLVKNQAEGNISLTILGFGRGNLNDALMEKLTNGGDGNYFYLDSLREGQKVFREGLTGTIETIAKDVKIQVEFNPGKVSQYRLIGYANRRLRPEDFKNDRIDAGDIGAGHQVTALYEVVPAGVAGPETPVGLKYQKPTSTPPAKSTVVASPEMLTVKLRYKQPDGQVSTELSQPLTDGDQSWEKSGNDFRFTSGVALWGMLLRNSQYAGSGDSALASRLIFESAGSDTQGHRAELADLIRKWSARR